MYKIVYGSSIIDVVDDLVFVRYDPDVKCMMRCKRQYAQGILSSDSSVIWHLDGYPAIGVDGYETVSAVAVSDSEGKNLRDKLAEGEVVEPPSEDEPQESAMSIQEMRVAIIALQNADGGSGSGNADEVWDEMAAAYDEGVQSA